ncbi:MAG: LysM peptidoglycan-binding domain-containing protein [Thermoleophilaceae bacterium]
MRRASRSPGRLLAPIALIVAAVAFIVVLSSSGTSDTSGSKSSSRTTSSQRTTTTKAPAAARRRSYTVKVGDTLGAIAERTGVPVATLQELNPALDPQNLVAGQKIKLRE